MQNMFLKRLRRVGVIQARQRITNESLHTKSTVEHRKRQQERITLASPSTQYHLEIATMIRVDKKGPSRLSPFYRGTYHHAQMSLVVRKPVFGASDQVRHKPGCTDTEDGRRLEISDLESKGADQPRGYREADLRLFSHMQKAGFLTMRLK